MCVCVNSVPCVNVNVSESVVHVCVSGLRNHFFKIIWLFIPAVRDDRERISLVMTRPGPTAVLLQVEKTLTFSVSDVSLIREWCCCV